MVTPYLEVQPLTPARFARFGDVIACEGPADQVINRGMCERFHDLAEMDFGPQGRPGISLFKAKPCSLPLMLEMMERHPLGSQTFIPMQRDPFLVVVAQDANGIPVRPQAFLTAPGQGVSYHRNTWHGVLTTVDKSGLFAVVDRIGPGENLQEHWFEKPVEIKTVDSR
ncbi:MAG: ureidoglycolate lyase [Pseudomonadota bacterium]